MSADAVQYELWRADQRKRDEALCASALRRLARERDRYQRNREARLAYARTYYAARKAKQAN